MDFGTLPAVSCLADEVGFGSVRAMEEHPSGPGDPPGPRNPAEPGPGPAPEAEPARPNPEAEALAAEAEEIRRLVEAGAGTPEAIRELAARLRAHREREEVLWRTEIRPGLVKEGKGRLRARPPAAPAPAAPPPTVQGAAAGQRLWLGLALLGIVVVAVLAATTSVWLLVLPVLALLAWAWKQGQDGPG